MSVLSVHVIQYASTKNLKMNDIIETIQRDILDPRVSLTTILLKAKVLAHQLKNERFKQWIKNELDGYPDDIGDTPDYRIIETQSLATIVRGRSFVTDIPISLANTPDRLREAARTVKFAPGIQAADAIAQGGEPINFPWPADWIAEWEHACGSTLGFQQLLAVKRLVPPQIFAQMVQTVRSRLQDFVLELSDIPWNMGERPLPSDQIEKLVAVTIYNNNQGQTVSTFDQRGQQVQSQNNAARDVNISGGISVSNNADLVQAVRALRELLNQVEQGKQKEIEVAIEVLENAAQDNSVRKSEVVQAVETLSQVPTMRQRLEELVIGASSSIAASAIIEGIKFVLGIGA